MQRPLYCRSMEFAFPTLSPNPPTFSEQATTMKVNLLLLVCFPLAAYSQIYQKINLPSGLTGPESLAFNCKGEGPYTGLSDGRIFKFEGAERGWTEFAFTSPTRNNSLCDGTSDQNLGSRCGRPLGLQFDYTTCELYVADAYYGLMKVGRTGGSAISLASTAEGVPFRFTNSLEVDNENRVIYFTDSSSRFQQTEASQIFKTGDNTGRLMKYDIWTKQVTVLLRNLGFANGVGLSKGKDYAIVCEFSKGQILRYWLQGPKAGTAEFFARPPGLPDNISRNDAGDFWVALNNNNATAGGIIGVLLDGDGQILQRLLGDGVVGPASEVKERNKHLLIGSVVNPFYGITNV